MMNGMCIYVTSAIEKEDMGCLDASRMTHQLGYAGPEHALVSFDRVCDSVRSVCVSEIGS